MASIKTEKTPLLVEGPSNPFDAAMAYSGPLSVALMAVQGGLVFLFLFGTSYPEAEEYSPAEYYVWKDIMAMLLIGFGYLMTFLKEYGLGAVGFTMILTVVAMQLNVMVELLMRAMYGVSEDTSWPMPVGMATLIDSEFSAATLLITFGALIGRPSPYQMLILALSESFFYAFNKVIVVFGILAAEDVEEQ